MVRLFFVLAWILITFTPKESVWAMPDQPSLSTAESKLMYTEAMRLWQRRDQKETLEEALSKFEHALSGDPKNLEILTYLTRGYFLMGDAHSDDDSQKKIQFERAKEFGERGLETSDEYKKRKEKDGAVKAIDTLTEREVEVLYWTAASTGKWAKANGIFSSLKYKDQILSSIKRVEKLRSDFFYAAVPRYWGSFYAVAPSIAGGDMNKSKKFFEKAISLAPECLANRVLFAELYWVKEDNKKEFRKELEFVLKASNGPKELEPENMLEKKKAEKLLDKIDDLF